MKELEHADESASADSLSDVLPESAHRRPVRQPLALDLTEAARGEQWGDYELLEPLGTGAMGTVFKARHTRLNRVVALKRIRQGIGASEEQRKRFLREAEAVARLQHPHIVTLYDTGEVDHQPYLAMEYVPGQTLAEAIGKNPLPPRQAVECVKKVCEAVHYAHEHGVLHRDLKPSNVALDSRLEPRVMDFGLARLEEQDSEMTLSGMAIGSPSYMAPEQAAGKVREVGAASDVYSVGAIFYETLTGRPPFQADSSVETMRQVVEREPVSPRLLNARVPRDLETICLKCLEKDPPRRYTTAQELADDLGRFLRDEPIHARPAGSAEKFWRWCRRNRALASSGFAIVVLLLTLAVGSPIAAFRINRERKVAATEAAKSKQVATFLAGMLEGVKPVVAKGRDTTLLRDILDRTATRLDAEFKDQPEVEAQLRLVVGQAYGALDLNETAEHHLRIAWAIRRKSFGDHHPDTLAAKLAVALALEGGHKWTEARILVSQVLDQYRKQFGERDARTISALHILGNVLKRAHDFPASAVALREVVALTKSVYGNADPLTLSALEALGCTLMDGDRADESAACFEEILQSCKRLSRTNGLDTAFALGWLGRARSAQGRFAEANSLFHDSLALKRQLHPEGHPQIAWHLYYTAESLAHQAKYSEAEPLLSEAWQIASLQPAESLHLRYCLAQLGSGSYSAWCKSDLKACSQAETWRQRVAELEHEHLAAEH